MLKKEIKTRMRTWKTPAMISIYVLLLSVLVVFVFLEAYNLLSPYSMGIRPSDIKGLYYVLTVFQMILIVFIVPATTSSSISGERERRTFDLLICSRLSSFSIVFGKLTASLAQILLLLIVSLPILSILYLFGGVSPGNILILFSFYIINAFYFGSIGLFTSAYFRKTTTSTIVSYLITLFLTAGTFVLFVFSMELLRNTGNNDITFFQRFLLYLNPLSGLSSILTEQVGEIFIPSQWLKKDTWDTLVPLYINLGLDIVISSILLFLVSIKINPMGSFKRKSKAK
ncbi:ABC transporter permease [Thermohalobacter berrensis]|uniref:ABC transporter permease n=1 Tax=Thermohalobacter berrensis TaxID=99594 RepID=UPI001600659E|nr:ABC transporter permease [Thermohalobacter berrensis]